MKAISFHLFIWMQSILCCPWDQASWISPQASIQPGILRLGSPERIATPVWQTENNNKQRYITLIQIKVYEAEMCTVESWNIMADLYLKSSQCFIDAPTNSKIVNG